jgi:hypothetical protein
MNEVELLGAELIKRTPCASQIFRSAEFIPLRYLFTRASRSGINSTLLFPEPLDSGKI